MEEGNAVLFEETSVQDTQWPYALLLLRAPAAQRDPSPQYDTPSLRVGATQGVKSSRLTNQMTAEPSEPKCSLPWSEYLPLSTTSCLHQQTSRITKVAQKTTPFKLKHLKLYLSFRAFAKGSLNRSSGASRRTHDSTPAGRYVPQGSGPGRAGTATIPEQSPRQSPTLVHETESTDAMETSQARNPGWDLPTQDSDKVLNHAGALTHVSRPAGGGRGRVAGQKALFHRGPRPSPHMPACLSSRASARHRATTQDRRPHSHRSRPHQVHALWPMTCCPLSAITAIILQCFTDSSIMSVLHRFLGS